ncbi:hypothetical protein JCM18899A_50380 [Nocardioides sp. AN3]
MVSWARTSTSAGTSGPDRGPGGATAWAGSATAVAEDDVAIGEARVLAEAEDDPEDDPEGSAEPAVAGPDAWVSAPADGDPSVSWHAASASSPRIAATSRTP